METLEQLRAEFDRIDDQIHDLLMARFALVSGVARLKAETAGEENDATAEATGLAIRPAREAQMLRRIVARHDGPLPLKAIMRIWREIVSASSQLQFKTHGALADDGSNSLALWDVARFYLGTSTPLSVHESYQAVFRQLSLDPCALGLVPTPTGTGAEPPCPGLWWSQLADAGTAMPRVIARFPLLAVADRDDGALAELYVLAHADFERSDDDATLVILDTKESLSRDRVARMIVQAGFTGSLLAALCLDEAAGSYLTLLTLDGYLADQDPKLAALKEAVEDIFVRITIIGGYPKPIRVPASPSN